MARIEITDIEDAIFHYQRYFNKPSEVLKESALPKADKIRLLESWKQDIELKEVAEEENMLSSTAETDILDEIVKALLSLKAPDDTHPSPPTKFGRI